MLLLVSEIDLRSSDTNLYRVIYVRLVSKSEKSENGTILVRDFCGEMVSDVRIDTDDTK